ncbi:hypothetical protein K1X84_11985 [bacterium]|nr:hypothetical protein [bacterium]
MNTQHPFRYILIGFSFWMFSLSGCYTVLKQSQEYYGEFGDQAAQSNSEAIDDSMVVTEYDEQVVAPDDAQTVVINRYYASPWWRPWPYASGWSLAVGYSWYPSYTYWYDPYWDYYYWGGCYYPTHYGGWYHHYYPQPWYDGGSPYYSNRSYGQRRYNTFTNSQNPLLPGISTISAGSAYGGRSYKTSSASNVSDVKSGSKDKNVSKGTQRKYKSGSKTAAKPATEKKAKSGSERKFNNGSKKSGDSKRSNNSDRSYKSSTNSWGNGGASRSASSGGSQSKSNSAPRSSGGGRSYKK